MPRGRNTGTSTRDNPLAAQALAQAITSSRKGPNAPVRFQRNGRLDRRSLHRVGVGQTDVYTRKGAPAPDKVRVTILLDGSASMHAGERAASGNYSRRMDTAAQVGRDLAGATELLPWVTADMVAFTSSSDVLMFPIWESGKPTSDLDNYGSHIMQGTEEGYAIAYAYDTLMERLQAREQGLIIIVSDGAPAEPKHVKSVVETARENNVPVVSVALVKSAQQPAMYGDENVVKYDKNPRKLARDMAKVIGRVL